VRTMKSSSEDLKQKTIVVPEESSGMRLDVFLSQISSQGTTRSAIQKAIKLGKITIDEKEKIKASSIIHSGHTIRIETDAFESPEAPSIKPENIELKILYEDSNVLAVDKPAGLTVHSGIRNEHPTLVDALINRYPDLTKIGDDKLRPGIVHRLDKETSGVILVAKTPEMFESLKNQFKTRHIKKTYLALVRGIPGESEGRISLPLKRSKKNPLRRTTSRKGDKDAKDAVTEFFLKEKFRHYALLEVHPLTGRMHQIRVHLSHIGFPVVADPLYGKQTKDPNLPPLRRQFLHAASITFSLPSGKLKTIESGLPAELQEVTDTLRIERERPPQKGAKFNVPSSHRILKH